MSLPLRSMTERSTVLGLLGSDTLHADRARLSVSRMRDRIAITVLFNAAVDASTAITGGYTLADLQ